jgi:AraC family ethanolamine operon transcriptional activator
MVGGVFMTAQRELVRRIDRYLIAAGAGPVHISELCEHFKVSRRTLHFRDVLGIGPIAFCAASGSMMSVLY